MSQATDVFHQNWFHKRLYASPPIFHDSKDFEQSSQRKSTYDDPCNSSLVITTVVPKNNENVYTTANFVDLDERPFKKPEGRNSSPCPKNKTLKLVACTFFGLDYKRKEF